MGVLRAPEMGPLLLRATRMTRTELASKLEIDDRVLRGILHQDWQRKAAARDMLKEFRENLPVFWSEWADAAVDSIREEGDLSKLHALLAFPMEIEYATLSKINPAASSDWKDLTMIAQAVRNDLFGRTYVAAAFYGHAARGRHSEINPQQALKRQEVLVNNLLLFLAQFQPANELTTFLGLKIGVERRILVAELLAREKTKQQLADFVDNNGFFKAICDYNDKTPRLWKAPWSGLSIASFLQRSEHYEELLRRLFASKAFASVEQMRARDSYDSHFDDFDQWYASLNSQEKEADDA
jgi:hypothetical protein